MKDIAGLIIAGGYSSRMGDFKPLLPVKGKPLIQDRILSMAKADISPIFVVTGHRKDELEAIIEDIKSQISPEIQVAIVYNPDYDKGMFTSIKAGVEIISEYSEKASEKTIKKASVEAINGIILLPVDYPLINESHYKKLYEAWLSKPEDFAVPCYYGKKGHPLLIPMRAWDEIISYMGNKGLKGITNEYEDRDEILRVEMNDERVLLDMDTPKDYNTILEWNPKDTVESRILGFKGRLFLVRHGETELHKEKIFLGQTDVPLSEIGKKQAVNVAKELSGWKLKEPLLLSSDLSRARESAEIIRDNIRLIDLETRDIGEANSQSQNTKIQNSQEGNQSTKCPARCLDIIEETAFRELNLGTWDGQYISKIKAERLEEYEKRGLNLLAYKSGYEGENFYDLQYRVMKRLGDYMKEYPSGDLILVAHSGGIRIILCNLLGIPLEEMKNFFVPRGSLNLVSF